jgi:hypothetical protein
VTPKSPETIQTRVPATRKYLSEKKDTLGKPSECDQFAPEIAKGSYHAPVFPQGNISHMVKIKTTDRNQA